MHGDTEFHKSFSVREKETCSLKASKSNAITPRVYFRDIIFKQRYGLCRAFDGGTPLVPEGGKMKSREIFPRRALSFDRGSVPCARNVFSRRSVSKFVSFSRTVIEPPPPPPPRKCAFCFRLSPGSLFFSASPHFQRENQF